MDAQPKNGGLIELAVRAPSALRANVTVNAVCAQSIVYSWSIGDGVEVVGFGRLGRSHQTRVTPKFACIHIHASS